MKIDTNAFIDSLPIMGVGLLGIFIVTIVIILGIYLLKALTAKTADSKASDNDNEKENSEEMYEADIQSKKSAGKKESAMDLLKEREKKDFLETDDANYISRDL